MKGVLIVEAPSLAESRKSTMTDGFEGSLPKARMTIVRSADHASNPGGGNDAGALFNGTTRNGSGHAATADDGKTFRGYGKGDTLTLTLATAESAAGFDLTEIRTITGHSDARASQRYTLLAATAREPEKFVAIESVNIAARSGATEVRIAGREATQGIVALRFEFNDGPLGYNLYREIIVLGVPAALDRR